MSTQFMIFTTPEFAHRKGKPNKYVCYRTVIAHALQIKMSRSTREEAKKAFLRFKNAFESSQEFTDEDFVFFYPVVMNQKVGYLLIDKSNGYYPLVFYPYKVKGASRTSALKEVIRDMNDNIDVILSKISTTNWNMQLQNSLQDNNFHYAEDKTKSA